MKSKKLLFSLGVLIVLLAAAGLGYRAWASNQSASEAEIQTATLQTGSLASTLSSSGNVRSGQNATLTWQTSGKVLEVLLQPGDVVEEGQVLAELDPGSLSNDLIQARQNLIDALQAREDLYDLTLQQAQALQATEEAQANLDNLKINAAEQASQAQLAVAEAEDELNDAERTRTRMNYPHSSDPLTIEKAETDYLMAKAAYKEAMKKYNEYSHKNLTNPDRARALSELVSARDKMNTTLAKYNWYLLGYKENEIDQADGQVAVAVANLTAAQSKWESLKDGVSEAAIALAEAQLEGALSAWEDVKDGPSEEEIAKAQAAIDIAQATLDRAQLTAPFPGTITEVGVKTGDLVNSGETAFRIDDLASLYIDLQVSEIDLADLQVGQKATLEFDAIPDKTYNGEVTEIGMIGNVSQGVVNYPVTVKVTDPDADIRPGMTAAVSIILDQREGALLVPNKAIRTSAGQQTVTVLYEGQQISVPVTVGLVGDSMSEILSDQLRAGDVVVLNGSTSSTTSTDQQFQRGFEGGGEFVIEGGPPPGMP